MRNDLPSIKKSIFLILIGFGIGFFVALAYSFISIIFTGNLDVSVEKLRVAMLLGELLIPVPVLIWVIKNKLSFSNVFRIKPVKSDLYFPAILTGLGLIVLIDEFDRIMGKIFTPPAGLTEIEALMAIDSILSAILIIGIIVVLGPVIEEMLFRGFFQKVLEERLSSVTNAVLVSALTFAVLHFNPWWLIQIYILGFFMAFFAYRTGSILIPLLIHALNNGISVLASQFSNIKLEWYVWHGHVNPLIILLAILLTYWGVKRFIALTE